MRKSLILFFLGLFGLSFAQVYEFEQVDRIVNQKFIELNRKYKKKKSEERQKEEAEIYQFWKNANLAIIEKIKASEPTVDLNSIEKPTTKEAQFEGQINGFRKLFAENFDTSAVSSPSGTFTAVLRFLVDEKGDISNAIVEGKNENLNVEALRTFYILKEKGKWFPAESDGVAVKSVFIMPLTMRFE